MNLSVLESLIEDLPYDIDESPIIEVPEPASPCIELKLINSEASQSVYRAISNTQIRLIQVHPGGLNDIISCSLEIAELAAAPTYQALSYVWGGQAGPETISLQGSDWRVTRNLAAVLRRLRETSPNQPTWIDALCINQSDESEQNEQVSQMRHVYSSASLTILWLGTGEDDTIKKLLDIIAFCFCTWDSEYGPLTIQLPPRAAVCFLTAMHATARQEYWQRAWVAQEIMFSKNVWLTYGSSEIPYDFFSQIWNLLCDTFLQMRRQMSAEWPRWRSFSILARVVKGGPNALPDVGSGLRGEFISLEQWARTGASKRSTDRRDVVFAYHGCFPPHIRNAFKIKYALSLREVLTTMTRLYLQTTGSLNTILNATRNLQNKDLPSWVPIGQPADASPLNVSLWNSPRRNASGSKPAQFTFIDIDTISAICVKAIKIGAVSRAAPRMSYKFDALEKWIEYGDVYDDTRHSFMQALEGLQESLYSSRLFPLVEAFLDVAPDSPLLEDFNDWLYRISSDGIPLEFRQNALDLALGYSPQLRGHWLEQKRNMTTEFWQQLMDTSLIHSHELEDQRHDRGIESLPGFETPLYKRFCDLPLLHNNRRMFSYKLKDSTRGLDDGYGLGGDRLEPGDTICVILGCSTPVVLRQKEEHYLLVADAVMPGFMSGEAVQGITYEDVEEFVIK